MADGLLTGAVVVDFRKYFDTIHHQKLLHKLTQFGVRDDQLNWFLNYLLDPY